MSSTHSSDYWRAEHTRYNKRKKTANNLVLLELTGSKTMHSTSQYRTVGDACESLSVLSLFLNFTINGMLGSIIWWGNFTSFQKIVVVERTFIISLHLS